MASPKSNSLPANQAFIDDHLRGGRVELPRTALPRTVVPDYLDETPLQEQGIYDEEFHRTHNTGLSRIGVWGHSMADNLNLISRNLSDTEYFEMGYDIRRDYPEHLYPPEITGLEVSSDGGSEVEIGATLQLTVTVDGIYGHTGAVTWDTSNDAVATVDASGLVTGVTTGTADIIAVSSEDEDFSDSLEVTVVEPAEAPPEP